MEEKLCGWLAGNFFVHHDQHQYTDVCVRLL